MVLLLFLLFSLLFLFVPGVVSSDEHLWMFRPRPRDDRRPRPRDRKEDEGKEEPKARLDFFVSLPNLPEDICTDDANEDERFLRGERRRTEGIL